MIIKIDIIAFHHNHLATTITLAYHQDPCEGIKNLSSGRPLPMPYYFYWYFLLFPGQSKAPVMF